MLLVVMLESNVTSSTASNSNVTSSNVSRSNVILKT